MKIKNILTKTRTTFDEMISTDKKSKWVLSALKRLSIYLQFFLRKWYFQMFVEKTDCFLILKDNYWHLLCVIMAIDENQKYFNKDALCSLPHL